ncbi:hypothetical protein QR680_006185 [Steinernema hermaphroditum]|uniref:SKP1 component POZ domain-containing protein n=1 Tax=Steinernema hermaphroditum TaxID=289476 RepID=A0AA39LWZ3_9BILA|nr:hypothetical protein QR680_006185 [Steinernema hermaphroditum]
MDQDDNHLLVGLLYLLIVIITLPIHLIVLMVFISDKTFRQRDAYKLMIHIGVADFIQLLFHVYTAFVTISLNNIDAVLEKVSGGTLNAVWIAHVLMCLLLALNRLDVVGRFDILRRKYSKANLLKTMMADLGFDEDALPEEAIPMPSVNADALETIVDWLRMHEEEEPRSEEDRQTHRFNRNVSKEDTELLDKQFPRSKLAAVINAAYYLEMPDLIDTLVKYTANNLEGKTAEEMSKWLEIPLKKDERKNAADDQGADEGESSEKRERTEGDN